MLEGTLVFYDGALRSGAEMFGEKGMVILL